jgi:Domain of unknown function (DUF4190)/Septum formation
MMQPPGPPYPPQPPAGPPYPPQWPAGPPYPHQPSAGQYPPPYPPPRGWVPPFPQAQTTSGFAVASLVLGFFGIILLSLIFGIIALGKTKAGGQRGRGMAIAGLVLSAGWIVIFIIAIVAAAMSPTHTVSAFSVGVGDCLADIPSGVITEVNTTSCDRPHRGEVVGVLKMPDGPYPGESPLRDDREKCSNALQSYSSTAAQDPNIELTTLRPTRETWEHGNRDLVCIATLSSPRTGSLKG